MHRRPYNNAGRKIALKTLLSTLPRLFLAGREWRWGRPNPPTLVPAVAGLPFADQVRVSPQALVFALGLSLLSSILFGLAPARQASRAGTAQHLADSGRSRSASRSSALWRHSLIAGEIGLSLILLASAGLLVQTFLHLSKTFWGFEPG